MTVLWFVGAPSGFFIFVYLGAVVHWVFFPPAFLWVHLLASLVKRMPCPNYARPVGWAKQTILGGEFESGRPPRYCEHCGYDLTGRGAKREG